MVTAHRRGTGTNQEAVRRHNLSTLLRQVHLAPGPVSRAELTSAMGLNRSTIAGLVAELVELGLTESTAARTAPRQGAGRPSQGVGVADDGPYVVAVDLGVDRVTAARVGLGGRIRARVQARVHDDREAWRVAADIAGLVRRVVVDAPPVSSLAGIGLAVPGMVRRRDGMVRLAPNLGWSDVSPGPMVLAALGVEVPLRVGNDADLGALSEHHRGVGIDIDDLVYVSGNVGVGAGVVSGGVPLAGAGGYAGEVGHLALSPADRACHCGARGCWETAVGGHVIARTIGCADDEVAELDLVLERYDVAPPGLDDVGRELGEGLAGIVNVLNPQVVVMGGYFRSLFRLVPDDVRAGFEATALTAPLESVSLALPGLDGDSVLLGAAELAFEPLLADPAGVLATALPDAARALGSGAVTPA
ncbi:ROK family protein [Nocardioides sp. CFH 31398]|uniref:ROK family protein n=1 Tax=Nocardioides sp. CFH 31398 TaxID=2919579 RepID=UPI001F05E006|nr:ROK family protein [Nocardioides sp. CFH 31398]MCH1866284.1 ROK family transcriptional regulator [Nocardioides sp. CFH 31398]